MPSRVGKVGKEARRKEKDGRARARTKEEEQTKELRPRHGWRGGAATIVIVEKLDIWVLDAQSLTKGLLLAMFLARGLVLTASHVILLRPRPPLLMLRRPSPPRTLFGPWR